ncbi:MULTISPECIES: chaperone NapD [Psychromonas]|jgi:nitrate reductase NapD|uniref:chaperone NapD n=1 Tax=Psychromonas TaxID=67572 RepID=UPI000425F0C2|nr:MULTISPECIES: chaperone NapD [Psychromonas]MBB1273791.1 chaperone NapD [Psychromonas sp. SR45-3]
MKEEELHVSSLIVHVKSEQILDLTNSIKTMPRAELVTVTEHGKAIVIIEAANQRQIMECIDQINDIDGVVHTSLVYHEFEKSTQNNSEEIQ